MFLIAPTHRRDLEGSRTGGGVEGSCLSGTSQIERPEPKNGTQVQILEFVGLYLDPLRILECLRWIRIIPSGLYRRYRIPSPLCHHPGHTGALRRYGERDPRGLRALRFLVILEGWIPLGALGAGILGAHVRERDRTLQ